MSSFVLNSNTSSLARMQACRADRTPWWFNFSKLLLAFMMFCCGARCKCRQHEAESSQVSNPNRNTFNKVCKNTTKKSLKNIFWDEVASLFAGEWSQHCSKSPTFADQTGFYNLMQQWSFLQSNKGREVLCGCQHCFKSSTLNQNTYVLCTRLTAHRVIQLSR